MLTLHIEAPTINELITATRRALHMMDAPAEREAPKSEVVLPHAESKPRGRPRKTEVPAPSDPVSTAPANAAPAPASPVEPPVSAPTPAPTASTEPAVTPPAASTPAPAAGAASYTVADCRAALAKVNELHGMAACVAVLQSVGVDRVSLVPEDRRAEFIAACEAKAA